MKHSLFWMLILSACALFAEEFEFEFQNDLDKTSQLAAAWVPDGAVKSDPPRPLLLYVHFMSGDRNSAKKLGFYDAAEKRDWLVVAPELHGKNTSGKTSCAALEAQHDSIAAINYMKEHYSVDESRIYVAGRSMGGQLTQIMLAKYPDIFAAGVAGQACSDLTQLEEIFLAGQGAIRKECGDNQFEYKRRSAAFYAPNFASVPVVLWHGTNDGYVSYKQTERLYREILKYQPFAPPVIWLANNGHLNANVSAEWVCSQLEPYQNAGEIRGIRGRWFPELKLVTDENKSFFYLDLKLTDNEKFGKISTVLTGDELNMPLTIQGANSKAPQKKIKMNIECENISEVTIDMAKIPQTLRPNEFFLKSDSGTAVFVIEDGKKSKVSTVDFK